MLPIIILIVSLVGVSCDVRPHPLVLKGSVEKLIKTVPWTWQYLKTSMKAHGPITVYVDVISKYKLKGGIVQTTKVFKKLKPKDCSEILDRLSHTKGKNGVYTIYPDGRTRKRVYCDMTTEGGGWTVILRRRHGSVDFKRGWSSYKNGFGIAADEYWLGNDAIYALTKRKPQELRFHLENFSGKRGYAKYSRFSIANEANKYRLSVGRYRGTTGDGFSYHSGKNFSTIDRDNDQYKGSCANRAKGAWWYGSCDHSTLTGPYHIKAVQRSDTINWEQFTGGKEMALKKATMMIRTKA